jgi:hypothetical protein
MGNNDKFRMLILAIPKRTGYILATERGHPVDNEFLYESKIQAYEAARKKWPGCSSYQGYKATKGYYITIDAKEDLELMMCYIRSFYFLN